MKKTPDRGTPETEKGTAIADSAIAQYLKALYKPQLKKLIERFSVGSSPDERGFYTDAAQRMNTQLGEHGLEIAPQFANDLYTGRKIRRDGVGLSLAYRLGVLIGNKPEPENAIALFYVWACGLWPEKGTGDNILEAIQYAGTDMDSKALLESIQALILASEQRTAQRLDSLHASPPTHVQKTYHPLSAALRELNPCSDEITISTVRELFSDYPESADAVIAVLVTGTALPVREDWLNLSYAMNRLTGDMWPPTKIEELAREC